MKILNIGNNRVSEYFKLLKSDSIDIFNIDIIDENLFSNITDIDIIFLNIDTKMNLDGSQNIDDIQKYLLEIRKYIDTNNIINTTTLLPNTNNLLQTHYLPIFFNNNQTDLDFLQNENWLFATYNENEIIKHKLTKLFQLAKTDGTIKSSNIKTYSIIELELFVYITNSYLATKISFFNEIYDLVNFHSIDYSKILEINKNKNTIDSIEIDSNNRGFGGEFLMKHLLAFYSYLNTKNYLPNYIINSVLSRNIKIDRKQLDWLPPNDNFSETKEKELLQDYTLNKLNIFCNTHNIDTSDCIERNDIILKILDYKKNSLYNIPFLHSNNPTTTTTTNTTNLTNTNTINNSNNSNNPNTNLPSHIPQIQRQQGIPLQINQPPPTRIKPNNPFNMNVRNNNHGMFMNMRPSSNATGVGRSSGAVRFGRGGVQMG